MLTLFKSYVKLGDNLWTTYIGVNPGIIAFLYRAEFLTDGLHCCYCRHTETVLELELLEEPREPGGVIVRANVDVEIVWPLAPELEKV